MAEQPESQGLLERIRELQVELNRIYCVTHDLLDEKFLAVSNEFDQLLVEYLRQDSRNLKEQGQVRS
jgi:hypothetical protein